MQEGLDTRAQPTREQRVSFAHPTRTDPRGVVPTPNDVAAFMASLIPDHGGDAVSILDPAAGTAVLACSAVHEFIRRGARRIHVLAYEIEPVLSQLAMNALAGEQAERRDTGVDLTFEVRRHDFLENRSLADRTPIKGSSKVDVAILNPPYYKIGKGGLYSRPAGRPVQSSPNVYTLFLARTIRFIREGGSVVAIAPRSWFSGSYFRGFRSEILAKADLVRVHSFIRRDEAFKEAGVLQETTVFALRRRSTPTRPDVTLSVSLGRADLSTPRTFIVPWRTLNPDGPGGVIRVPETVGQLEAIEDLGVSLAVHIPPSTPGN